MPSALGAIFEVTVRGTVLGQRVLTVRHYKTIKTAVPPEMGVVTESLLFAASLANDAVGGMSNTYRAACATNYNLDEFRVQAIQPTRFVFQSAASNLPGLVAGDCTASNVSGVISFQGELAGRGGQGRTHMPGVANISYANGNVTNAYFDLLTTLGSVLEADHVVAASTAVYRPIIFNRAGTFPDNSSEILQTFVQRTLRTMRRRTVGLGI